SRSPRTRCPAYARSRRTTRSRSSAPCSPTTRRCCASASAWSASSWPGASPGSGWGTGSTRARRRPPRSPRSGRSRRAWSRARSRPAPPADSRHPTRSRKDIMVTSITSVAVVGAGYMGGGIAQSFALAGLPVTIADASADATQAAYERLLAESQEFEDEGLYDAGATETIRGNLRTAASIEEAVADVDFVEEAVFESVEVKHDVLGRIAAAARPDAIIGSNTSTIPARVLATAVTNPERFLTVHFSNPAPFIPGVELVPSE